MKFTGIERSRYSDMIALIKLIESKMKLTQDYYQDALTISAGNIQHRSFQDQYLMLEKQLKIVSLFSIWMNYGEDTPPYSIEPHNWKQWQKEFEIRKNSIHLCETMLEMKLQELSLFAINATLIEIRELLKNKLP